MKLLKCHIENFGKLKDFNYEFSDGLNVINEKNGFGKTTFASFIKAMFYGLESTAKRTTALTDRKKYFPWQGGMYGGNIEFEINNKKYRIERFFGIKEQEDNFKLYDLSTNLESEDYTEKIGEEIFKINKEAYERSTYVPGQNIEIKMNDSLNAKLGNILEGENDINTSEIAIKNLDEAMKTYKKTGERGLINENKERILNLQRKIETGKSEEIAIAERKRKLEETNIKITEREKIKKELQAKLTKGLEQESKRAKKQNYDLILKKYNENLKSSEDLKEFFKGEVPTNEELDILFDKCIQVEKYKVEVNGYELIQDESIKLKQLETVFENKEITEEDINKKISDVNEIKDIENKIENLKQNENILQKQIEVNQTKISTTKKINIVFLILAILLIVTGISISALNVFNTLIGIGLLVIGTIFAIISIVILKNTLNRKKELIKNQDDKQNLLDVLERLIAKRKNIEQQIDEFVRKYLKAYKYEDRIIALTEIKANFSKYKELKDKIDMLNIKKSKTTNDLILLQDSIKKYLEKYFDVVKEPYSSLAQEMKLRKNEFNRLSLLIEQSKMEKEEFERKNDINEIRNYTEENIDFEKNDLEQEIKNIDLEINALNDEKISNKNQIDLLESTLDELEESKEDLDELVQKEQEYERKYEILKRTTKLLKQAKESFSTHYLNRMERGFEKYINLIDKEKIEANIDVNLNVKLEQNGGKRDVSYFSTGYQDLIYLCIRFSLIDALFEEENPFVILDDPFVNLDDEKIKNSVDLIKKISNKYQIIYFVCHESRS